jgi:hypothetical protein
MRDVARGVVLGAIALMVIAGSVPASARAPLKEIFTDEGWFTLPDIGCNGFTLTEVMDSEAITMTTFFNKTGDPMKIATRANFFGTITNTTSGHTFRDHASFTETINVPKGTTTVNGISYHYIVGGQGQVFAEVGHKISVSATGEVTFQGGQADLASDPHLLSLCDSLM